MSTLKTTNLQHEASANPNIVLDNTGGTTIANANVTGNVDITGDLDVTGDVQVESLNGGQLAGFRNLIINGDFRIFQRGTAQQGSGSGGSRLYFGPDRFFKFNNADTVGQIDTSSDDFGGVTGRFHYACRVGGSQNSRIFGQCIEGPLPKGMDVTYSAWVRFSEQPTQCYMTTHSTPLVGLNDFSGFYGGTGTNQVYVNPDGWDAIYPGNNIWFKIQRTFTPASPELGLGVGFQPIFSGNSTANVDITGVQVEFGSEATPFEYRPIGTELDMCRRYCYRWEYGARDTQFIFQRSANTTTYLSNVISLPTPLRVWPSVQGFNTETWRIIAGAAYDFTFAGIHNDVRSVNFTNVANFSLSFTRTDTGGSWDVVWLRSNFNGNEVDPPVLPPYIIFSAEL
jgi:hypothetical protein